ncbi:hypothetical protein [Sulfobacillus harzensis]|uniref:Uncharacterized protein n=1 Tax=Sulfobacillus harzensis TaxID=2729629 RepID=A0A7Y0L4F8_9FIRM|nr:hypothetical protein [Sulfobacillus harzensis]NMP23121.1 hypothetical protein [Sulfobacillus harzensis]
MQNSNPSRWQQVLRWGFGVLWIIDGFLKLQPGMFNSGLVVNVVGATALDNQPAWLTHLMFSGINLWHAGLPLTTIAMALWEVALGIGIIAARGRWFRITLWAVVAWSAIVWVMAEGLGGILSGNPTFPGDSPGSTPFYAAAAILMLYPNWVTPSLHRLAGVFWALATVVQLLPYNWSRSAMGGIFGNVTMNGQEPAAIDRLNNAFIELAYRSPIGVNVVLIIIMALLAWAWFTRPTRSSTWWLTLLFLFGLWAIPQAFATLFTGTATDLGNEFPLALLLWAARHMANHRAQKTKGAVLSAIT